MFNKKTFTLVDDKKQKKMYSAKNVKWIKYLILGALAAFIFLMIFANVKSKSYYRNLKDSKKAIDEKNFGAGTRSILSLGEISTRAINCQMKTCNVTCSGDMTDLNNFLKQQKGCTSMTLRISDCTFPNDRLHIDWVAGTFKLSLISISRCILNGIDDGAFNQQTTADVTLLELKLVQLSNLTEKTFAGLKALQNFVLINEIEKFSGESFLKPMVNTLKNIEIKHVTDTATNPGPWLLGGNFPNLMKIVFDGSNFGGFIKASTFEHLKDLAILTMNSCKISYIADGTFDFMMKHYVVYISLQSNQLKKLSGAYLTKVTSLKRIDLHYNPWDCTCELEELITNYKRYPEGFGENVKCSTPEASAGKLLNAVDVEKCVYTTTEVSTTSTAQPETSTPTTEEASTTTSSTTSTTTKTATESTTSSAASTTTEFISSTSSKDSASSTPVSVPSTISTTTLTNPIDEEDTSPSPQTTPSPQNRTTTVAADTIFIECQRYTIKSFKNLNSEELLIEISPPDTFFDITSLSETSAQLKMEDSHNDLALIWFYDQPHISGSGKNIQIVGEFKVGCQSELEDSLIIEGLAQKRAYTFCLVNEGVHLISPFNCRSYYTSDGVTGIDERSVWLWNEDKALTIGLFVLLLIIFMCLGSVLMFIVLRLYPTLLKGSKRVVVVNRSTGDVLIMPRPKAKSSLIDSSYRDSYETNTTIPQRRFSETSIQSGRSYLAANNYEDIEYRWKMNVVNDMVYSNRVPKSPPPPLPKRVSQDKTKECSKEIQIAVVDQKGNDYGYIG